MGKTDDKADRGDTPRTERAARLAALFGQLRSVTDEIEQLTRDQGAASGANMDKADQIAVESTGVGLRQRVRPPAVELDTDVSAPTPPKRLRPKLYPHTPAARLDKLEENGFEELVLMDALKIKGFEGFYNLALFMLAFSLIYNSVRNVHDHGSQLRLADFFCTPALRGGVNMVTTSAFGYMFSFYAFFLIRLFRAGAVPRTVFSGAYALCQVTQFVVSTLVVFATPTSPFLGGATMMTVLVLALKCHSYVATNYALYCEAPEEEKRAALSHVSVTDFAYFLAAPTLVYESAFPRSDRIRWRYVVKKSFQLAAALLVQYAVVAQFMLPVFAHHTKDWYLFLKLALPSFCMWLAGFYAFFHCWLNIVAELLRFADRQFFLDWWNSTSLDSFWRKWNNPVHEWCLRHIYVESMYYYKVSDRPRRAARPAPHPHRARAPRCRRPPPPSASSSSRRSSTSWCPPLPSSASGPGSSSAWLRKCPSSSSVGASAATAAATCSSGSPCSWASPSSRSSISGTGSPATTASFASTAEPPSPSGAVCTPQAPSEPSSSLPPPAPLYNAAIGAPAATAQQAHRPGPAPCSPIPTH